MIQIGVSICPIMTRDIENPVYCNRDCVVFCTPTYLVEGHDGYCGLMSEKVIKI